MGLKLADITKTYRQPDGTTVPVLDVPQFTLDDGEQVVLLGDSGGGKTTLLNVISGITTPDTGTVSIDGTEITALPEPARDRFRAERIGFVFQTFNLLSAFTALENVLLGMSFGGKNSDRDRAVDLLKRVGLADRLNHRPSQLSVGQQQRVSVARGLANRPTLLLADEPTANVDPKSQQAVLDLIREACTDEKVSLLMVTHSSDVAAQFPQTVRLEEFNRVMSASTQGAN